MPTNDSVVGRSDQQGAEIRRAAPLCHLEGTIDRFAWWVEQKLKFS
jgi:hypothetical protein